MRLQLPGYEGDAGLELCFGAVVGHHEIGSRQPSSSTRLGGETGLGVGFVHPASNRPVQFRLVAAVDYQSPPPPTQMIGNHRDFHHHRALGVLCSRPDGVEDVGMGDGLQPTERYRIGENDGGEGTSIDPPILDNLRPGFGNGIEGRTVRLENGVPNLVGVDGDDSMDVEKPADGALSRGQAATEYPPALLSCHVRRR